MIIAMYSNNSICITSKVHNIKTAILTMMALTISFWLFFNARTALARDTLACDITSSISFASIPLSSTCVNTHTHTTVSLFKCHVKPHLTHKLTPKPKQRLYSPYVIYKDMYYTVNHKKRWQYICNHNSGKSWWILINFTYMETGINTVCK